MLEGRAAVQRDPGRDLIKSSKGKYQFCLWEEGIVGRRTGWGLIGLRATLQRRTCGFFGGHQAECEPGLYPDIKHSQLHPGLH